MIAVEVAGKAASRYARRVWWADRNELKNEAVMAALTAQRTFDPQVGVPEGGYLWRACVLHLKNYLLRQSAPVSETSHRLESLKGVHRAAVNDQDHAYEEEVEEELDHNRWRARVRKRMHELFAMVGQDHGLAEEVLLGARKANEVALARGIDVGRVYRAAKRARELMQNDPQLYELMKER